MRISFDLDDTLICYDPDVPFEKRGLARWLHPWCLEPLRYGTYALFDALAGHGWEVWIYTTSGRSQRSITWWLRCYGMRVNGVITQQVYAKRLRRHAVHDYPSKNPAWFGIDLHVDDSEGVRMEGEHYGFDVHVVAPDDENWAQGVLQAAETVRRRLTTAAQ